MLLDLSSSDALTCSSSYQQAPIFTHPTRAVLLLVQSSIETISSTSNLIHQAPLQPAESNQDASCSLLATASAGGRVSSLLQHLAS
jgi:hypothetical protein